MSRYLDLLEKTLLDSIYDPERKEVNPWPVRAHTMIGPARLKNVRASCLSAIADNIPGDFVECGVWRGGATIMMAGVAREKDPHRLVHVCDSFSGVPPPSLPQDAGIMLCSRPELSVSLEEVQANFRLYDLLSSNVRFYPGLFKDTLPKAAIEQISVLRLDGDLYESTMNCLDNLYPKVSPGGFVIIDDFGAIPACAQAVREYRASCGIIAPMFEIDNEGVFWRA